MKSTLSLFTILLLFVSTALSADTERLKLATTTSTDNSGLLAVLNPVFEDKHNIKVDVISVGTGKAIRLAENGDVDFILVHAPAAEKKFVDAGYGIERKPVMHNDFVIIGPSADPASIQQATNLKQAMQRLLDSKQTFVSRGDDSGTHKKEKQLWDTIGQQPQAGWYLSVGQGMGTVLRIADDKQAYTLTDRGTYLAYKDKMSLEVLFEKDAALYNPYHVIMVNPEKHPHVNIQLARKYSDFIRSGEGQTLIRNFRVNGEVLFHPDAIK